MKKCFFIIILFWLAINSFSLFAAKHDLDIDQDMIDFTFRGHLAYANFSMLSNGSAPWTPIVEVGGQALCHFFGFSAGFEVDFLRDFVNDYYLIPCLFVIGFTDLLTFKCGYSLPIGDVSFRFMDGGIHRYQATMQVNLSRLTMNTCEGEIGLLTLYYDRLLFSLFFNVRIIFDYRLGNNSWIEFINPAIGLRIGMKPKNRSMVNLGLVGGVLRLLGY